MANNEQNKFNPTDGREGFMEDQHLDPEGMTAEEIKAYFDEVEPMSDDEVEALYARVVPGLMEELDRKADRRRTGTAHRARRAILMAACLTLVLSMAVQAFDIPIWESIGSWTQEHLDVDVFPDGSVDSAVDDHMFSEAERLTWGDEVCTALEEMGIFPSLPEWKPSGLTLESADYSQSKDGHKCLCAIYTMAGDEFMQFFVENMFDVTYEFQEAVERDVEYKKTLEISGIEYHSISNLDNNMITWYYQDFAFTIISSIDSSLLEKMVESTR